MTFVQSQGCYYKNHAFATFSNPIISFKLTLIDHSERDKLVTFQDPVFNDFAHQRPASATFSALPKLFLQLNVVKYPKIHFEQIFKTYLQAKTPVCAPAMAFQPFMFSDSLCKSLKG